MKKIKTLRNFTFYFSTPLNANIKYKVTAGNYQEAKRKLLKDFPTACDIEHDEKN
jgi:hypothetical protein